MMNQDWLFEKMNKNILKQKFMMDTCTRMHGNSLEERIV